MTIIERNVYEPGGLAWLVSHGKCKPLAPDVARLVSDPNKGGELRAVTWNEVMRERRQWQQERLARLRRCTEEVRAVRVLVRYFDIEVYTGWNTYIDAAGRKGSGGRGFSKWVRECRGERNPFGLCSLFPVRDSNEPLLVVDEFSVFTCVIVGETDVAAALPKLKQYTAVLVTGELRARDGAAMKIRVSSYEVVD